MKISRPLSIRIFLKISISILIKDNLENINIDNGVLQNIDINKILNQYGFGISNTTMLDTDGHGVICIVGSS